MLYKYIYLKMSDSTHILFLITASNCGACKSLKGDGTLNNGRHFMRSEYIKGILDTKHKDYSVKLAVVNFEDLRNPEVPTDISLFKYENNVVVQHKYISEGGKVRYLKYTDGKSYPHKEMDKSDTWVLFLQRTFSNVFKNHLYMYPAYYIVKTYDYDKYLKNNKHPLKIHGVHLNDGGNHKYHVDEKNENFNNPIHIIKEGYDILDRKEQPKRVEEVKVPEMVYVYDYDYEL